MSAKKAPKRKYGSFWCCPNCSKEPDFTHEAMMTHLKEAHGIDAKTTQGTKRMLMHIDGSDFYESQSEWTIAGLKFYQTTRNQRTGEDAMMWGGGE